ncbi:MAG: hypothetical protein ACR2MZ_12485 [Candidatus Dormibacter sp.]|uniref:hypothetical protein n=1 Tax=Candidatus Dormibacter sp. TaxID=2973982 RepID=UPI000DB0065D|nr:MAG: hypothetical protein DLM66_10865 [Candidatus Dormibacteraeota bacterium]
MRAGVYARWIGWAFMATAALLFLSNVPLPGLRLLGTVQAVPVYAALVGLALGLLRSVRDKGRVREPALAPATS